MQWKLQQGWIFALLLNTSLLIASCHTQPDKTTQYIDSSKANQSIGLKNISDTIIINQGKTLFVANCNSCHAIFKTDNYLQGVVQRLGENYLKIYLTEQDSLIEAKDKYALAIKNEFGNLGNSHNFDFSDEQLNAIFAYLRKYSS